MGEAAPPTLAPWSKPQTNFGPSNLEILRVEVFGFDSSTIFEIQRTYELSSKLGLVPYSNYTLPNAKDYMGIKFLSKLILRSI